MTTNLAEEARSRALRYFLISYVDLFGVMRAKLVPAAAIEDMARDGAGFAGFASWLDLTPAHPDLAAVPDPGSLLQLPWKPEVGWLAADLHLRGEPLAQAPRNLLRGALDRARHAGYEMRTGVEAEFFLLSPDGERVGDANDASSKPCYDQSALMRRYDVISELCDHMAALGWSPYQNDHEDGNGQFEMNWRFSDALTTADRHAFFKYMVKTVAEAHGLRATFMPKPFIDRTGSGCHVHLSLWQGDRNLFEDAGDELGLSRLGYRFIGGLMRHAPAVCAIANPTVNSYKRINAPVTLSGATWSPNAISYGADNRTHMIRIPDGGRIELRLPDGAANPYLLPAALLSAGLDGIERDVDPGPRLDIDMYANGDAAPEGIGRLPLNLLDALRALEASDVLRDGFGADVVASYVKLRRRQWDEFTHQLTDWERATTLDC
jgi:glutamate---methylamine ligase